MDQTSKQIDAQYNAKCLANNKQQMHKHRSNKIKH